MTEEIEELLKKMPTSKLKKIHLLATLGLKIDGTEAKHYYLLQILKIIKPKNKEAPCQKNQA